MGKAIRITLLTSLLIISAFSLGARGEKVADEEQIRQELKSNTKPAVTNVYSGNKGRWNGNGYLYIYNLHDEV